MPLGHGVGAAAVRERGDDLTVGDDQDREQDDDRDRDGHRVPQAGRARDVQRQGGEPFQGG